MTLRNFGHGSLAGGPIMLRTGWPHDPAKLPERWPHEAANRHRYFRIAHATKVLLKWRSTEYIADGQ